MSKSVRLLVPLALLALLAFPSVAAAGHTTDPRTPNLTPLGHIVEPEQMVNPLPPPSGIHTDLAFRGNLAFQGTWDGFNIRDISNPMAPAQVSFTSCPGNQGDVLVYGNILVRSWNSPTNPANTNNLALALPTCDGQPVQTGWEGLHVFDISNLADPQLVAQVRTPCGSHTATAVPDPDNGRLLIYNGPSSAATDANFPAIPTCGGLTVVSVPLANPAGATMLRHEVLTTPAGVSPNHTCHDISVFLDDVLLAACSGGPGFAVYSLGGPAGGTLEDPQLLYQRQIPTVNIGHSASFSWNGEVMIYGWEPGGGVAAECEEADHPLKKSFFYFRARTGDLLGTWTLPHPQGPNENCTLHNYNVAPFLDRHVMAHGFYQGGTNVIDFTNPGAPREIAYSDPPPRPVPPGGPFACCDLGGVWGSYWYNDLIYESHINEGLNIWRLDEPWAHRALSLTHLNPQTQEERMRCTVTASGNLRARRSGTLSIRVRVWNQGAPAVPVNVTAAGVGRNARTNDAGNATVRIRPTRAGTARIRVPALLNMEGCATSRRIAAAPRRGGGPGGDLTGRPARV